MQIEYRKIDELIPYVNNPRNNDDAVDVVASSIKQYGFLVPMVIDKDDEIVTGHTRFLAAKKLGLEDVPTIKADNLTPAQIKAFRLVDNKTAEYAVWDDELLSLELQELSDMGVKLDEFDLGDIAEEDGEIEEEVYTRKVDIPQYEITGEKPSFSDLLDKTKADELIKEINKSSLSEEEKEFLKLAAMRHIVFDYGKIAEYYAHSEPKIQKLMEESALVIIDYDDAIRLGYVKLREEILELGELEDEEQE